MKRLLLVCCLLLTVLCVTAKSKFAIRIWEVLDEYTHQEMDLDSLLVDVMHSDSTIIFQGLSYNQFTDKWFERQSMILRSERIHHAIYAGSSTQSEPEKTDITISGSQVVTTALDLYQFKSKYKCE